MGLREVEKRFSGVSKGSIEVGLMDDGLTLLSHQALMSDMDGARFTAAMARKCVGTVL
ncbi:MAG: hypothetical protein ABIH11_00070 [Candidatus Altiarchaeota archaeon]